MEHYDFKCNKNFIKYNLQKKKKNGNYRLDSCFASNTSEDMLQPITKYKKKLKKLKKTHTHTHTLNTKKWTKVD